jgi:hypothetical protein
MDRRVQADFCSTMECPLSRARLFIVMAGLEPRLSGSLGQFGEARRDKASSSPSPSPVIPDLIGGTHGQEMA